MTDTTLPPGLAEILAGVDTPTVCNAIETARGKRGDYAFTRGMVHASDPEAPPVFGFAKTARIRGNAPPDDAEATAKRRMDYYRYVAEGPRPGLVVIEDEDGETATGAFWGEVNTAVHRGFGLAGVLTNGTMRDLGDLASGFPVLAGSIGPSHHWVHVTQIGEPVEVFGMPVAPGDFVHADRHGAVVVPPDALDGLAAAIRRMQEAESIVLDAARAPGFDFTAFETAWAAFDKART